jgi:hypothetical protein
MMWVPYVQVREPYSVVMYLAERLDVPALLDLQLPEGRQKTLTKEN